jgi:hypothetical protein
VYSVENRPAFMRRTSPPSLEFKAKPIEKPARSRQQEMPATFSELRGDKGIRVKKRVNVSVMSVIFCCYDGCFVSANIEQNF